MILNTQRGVLFKTSSSNKGNVCIILSLSLRSGSTMYVLYSYVVVEWMASHAVRVGKGTRK
mgnify:FL=1